MKTTRTLLKRLVLGALAAAATTAVASEFEREQLRIVGSSTVYPFSSYVAEELGAITEHPTPVIESTGSGGGLKIFCEGDGLDTVDITNASRRMKPSEFERCAESGVSDITEFVIGADGIAVAQSKENQAMNLTLEQLTLAVAAKVPQNGELVDNPYRRWNEIDSSLPDREITIYGPPTTSGTRDAFEELVVEAATEEMEGYDGGYTSVRTDGPYIDSGENDNLIVQKLQNDTQAVGIFGYSFLVENANAIDAVTIDGVEPTPETISAEEYPVSRSLFFYTKNSHFDRVAGMDEYVEMFLGEQMIGEYGLLKSEGLIPLPEAMRESMRARFEQRSTLKLSDLE
jgi:phosphate transport system substrate-binding protein